MRYKNEPYVLSGDVYTLSGVEGQGGWSHYTGSAAWLYKVVLEDLLGINFYGDCVEFCPPLPRGFENAVVSIDGNGRKCSIEFVNDGKKGVDTEGMFVAGVYRVCIAGEQYKKIRFHY